MTLFLQPLSNKQNKKNVAHHTKENVSINFFAISVEDQDLFWPDSDLTFQKMYCQQNCVFQKSALGPFLSSVYRQKGSEMTGYRAVTMLLTWCLVLF